jgi:hemerythrin superfamily protein
MTSRIEKGIEAIASEVMGAVKATKGKVVGLTGVFAHLAREHGKVTGLLLRLKASSDPELRSELFPKIRTQLLSHEKGELAEVFPVLAEHAELAAFAEEHRRDAKKLETLIDDLSKTAPTEKVWSRRLADLIENVSQHAVEEENDFFPKASRVLGNKKTEQMLRRFEAAKAKIEKTIGAPKTAKVPTKPKAITARAEQTAHRVARRKKTMTPSHATVKRSGAKQHKAKAGKKTTGRHAKPT